MEEEEEASTHRHPEKKHKEKRHHHHSDDEDFRKSKKHKVTSASTLRSVGALTEYFYQSGPQQVQTAAYDYVYMTFDYVLFGLPDLYVNNFRS